MKNWTIYLGLGIVFTASMGAMALISAPDFVSGMIAVPGVGALLGALFQIARDAAAFEKQKYLQADSQVFSLGATSHMSTVAFDKHVEFCEEYMAEVHETIALLFREGPTKEAMECAKKLYSLRQKFAAWVPKSISLKLDPFENAIRQIGAKPLINALRNGDDEDARIKAIDEQFNLFANVLGMEKLSDNAPDQKEEIAVENVKEQIREILGITDLLEIRSFIIKRSADFARSRDEKLKAV